MSTSVNIVLFRSHKLKDDRHPLKICIIHNRKKAYINLSESIHPNDWDEEARWIKRSHPRYKDLNLMLTKKLHRVQSVIFHLQYTRDDFSLQDILSQISVSKSSSGGLTKYFEDLIMQHKEAHRYGSARCAEFTHSVLKKFNKDKDLDFKHITLQFLNRYEAAHLGKGNSLNSLSVYFRCLRSTLNKAADEGLYDKSMSPFRIYKIKKVQTRKRAISLDDLRAINKLKLEENSLLWHAKNYFLILFYACGMNFIDLALLKKEDIKGDHIEYIRAKQHGVFTVAIPEAMKRILDHYLNTIPGTLAFPIIADGLPPEKKYQRIYEAKKRFNLDLKKIAAKCELDVKLTSYVARHSWATLAMKNGVPLGVISKSLGHGDMKTTQLYLQEIDQAEVDKASHMIAGRLGIQDDVV